MSASRRLRPAEEFHAPGPGTSTLPRRRSFDVGRSYVGVTKPMLQLVLGALLVFVFFYAAARRARWCPAGCSSPARGLRLRPQPHRPRHHRQPRLHAVRALPVHALLLHPGQQLLRVDPVHPVPDVLPLRHGLRARRAELGRSTTPSASGSTASSATSSSQTVPGGVTGPMLLLLVPLEFFSNILVRPVTLALRLFANMFAGHLLLILFALGGEYLLLEHGGIGYVAGRHPGLGPRDRDRVPGAAGAVPAGLRLHPAERHVHLRCSRRRALRPLH